MRELKHAHILTLANTADLNNGTETTELQKTGHIEAGGVMEVTIFQSVKGPEAYVKIRNHFTNHYRILEFPSAKLAHTFADVFNP